MDNRQRFEAWVADQLGHTVDFVKSQRAVNVDRYYNEYIEVNYQAWKAGREATDQQVKQLAAENAALKDINAWCCAGVFKTGSSAFKQAHDLVIDTEDCLHDAVLAMLGALTTPATDAYLSQLRKEAWAEGVEMFADHLSGMNISASETSAREFASQLREGKAGEVCGD